MVMPSSVPPVRRRDGVELGGGFREGDVQHLLAALRAFEQELEGERRLAATRVSFDQIDALRRKASRDDLIQSCNPARYQFAI